MAILRTNCGKEYPCDFMGVAPGYDVLFVKVAIDYAEAVVVFQDPEETKVLEWVGDSGGVVRTETGYTKFAGFQIMKGKCPVRIRLEKEL